MLIDVNIIPDGFDYLVAGLQIFVPVFLALTGFWVGFKADVFRKRFSRPKVIFVASIDKIESKLGWDYFWWVRVIGYDSQHEKAAEEGLGEKFPLGQIEGNLLTINIAVAGDVLPNAELRLEKFSNSIGKNLLQSPVIISNYEKNTAHDFLPIRDASYPVFISIFSRQTKTIQKERDEYLLKRYPHNYKEKPSGEDVGFLAYLRIIPCT